MKTKSSSQSKRKHRDGKDQMNTFYFSIALVMPVIFYLLPLFLEIENPRPFLKILSLAFAGLGFLQFTQTRISKHSNSSKVEIFSQSLKKEILFAFVLFFCLTTSYLVILFQHLNSFFLADFDFLAIAEILNNSLLGNFFQTHHYGSRVTGNYLSHHFSPSILILSPFLFLSETRLGYAYGLLFFIIASYILITILLLKKNIRGNLFYFSLIFLSCNLYLHRLFFSYHFELLAVFFFLLFFVGKEFQKTYLEILSILLLLLLKEDMAIYLFFLGIYFLIQKDWKYGLSIVAVSLLYFFFVPKFFQSFIDKSAHVNWLKDWEKWGRSYTEIFVNLITNPVKVSYLFFSKWKILRDFVLSFNPVLLQPSLILVSLPIFLLHFISDRIWYNTLYNYYSYSVISFFVIGFILSLEKIKISNYEKYSFSILLFCISISLYSSSGDKFFPYSKIETNPIRVENIKNTISQIPKGKTVATQFDLGGFISRHNAIYPLHEKNLDKDYILVDKKNGITPYVDRQRIEKMLEEILATKSYSIIYDVNGIELYKKNSN